MTDTFDRLVAGQRFVEATLVENAPTELSVTVKDNATISAAALAALAGSAQIAAEPSEPLTEPVFSKAAVSAKGMLSHVEVIRDSFVNVRRDVLDLRALANSRRNQAKSLIDRVCDFLDDYLKPEELRRIGAIDDDKQAPAFRLFVAPDLHNADGLLLRPKLDRMLVRPGDPGPGGVAHNDESALFSAGAVVADDIRQIEALRGALVTLRRRHQQALEDLRSRLAALEADIPPEIGQLGVRERARAETLDDYAVAQRLLAEHWREIEAAYAERRRVIESHRGLFYVKVRETPLGRTLPDPLDLRPSSPDDLVPGCANRDTPLPAALAPFMQAVFDIPAGDWASLRPLGHLLPGRALLAGLVDTRRQMLMQRVNKIVAADTPGLSGLLQQNHALVREVAARPFNAAALGELQRQGSAILALGDLLAIPAPLLRDPARALHQRLDAAAGCLFARLRTIAPSIRLGWAADAEADRLPVETPERWPGLAQAEERDFNGVRTLVELVAWWFRQIDTDASGVARTAMRNLVRACLLLAASDDPQQLVQGRLKTIPGRFRIGEALRLTLNREAAPGTLLQLFDAGQRVIATLRVDDHDEQGTIASVASILDPQVERNPAIVLNTALLITGQDRG
ncbi:hypothetical protein [Cupriavidus consociatus]|uniref:hypothetical protein n=1 Tax=Cupriavidus consociatus TaxID=2821357 RepID=UPI001AE59E85|nr:MULTISPECIES: hypothetical protein [unclassified Cupriavidus]MBP0622467.1 hypothetical protein [Cupriavidus sp. LEh25]MDK2659153.1 hypothetical protein [Cupriavidus sp. LEh21]